MYPKTANRVHNVACWMNYIMHQVMTQTYLKSDYPKSLTLTNGKKMFAESLLKVKGFEVVKKTSES